MKLNFLFWNTHKKSCIEEIRNLAQSNDIDIIILSENNANNADLLLQLNSVTSDYFPPHPLSLCEKIKIFTKFHYDFISPLLESERITIRKLDIPGMVSINLICLHFGDKGSFSDESQSEMASELKSLIDDFEKSSGHSRTIVVGDFNMNPFEKGLIKANGLHATMSKKIALEKRRVVQNKEYPFFYNPMWSLLGDLFKDLPGTYYYRKSELVNYKWNIFDQVLLRPDLISNFDSKSLAILSHDGKKPLITKSRIPNKQLFSDHLPIKFTFTL